MKKVLISICVAASLLSFAGCTKNKKTKSATITNVGSQTGHGRVFPGLRGEAHPKKEENGGDVSPKFDGKFAPIFFTFDESYLSEESMIMLDSIAVFLEENPKATLLIAGHADERGTVEYNLALGQERAESVKRYLTLQRIDPGRISTVSYGEEMPLSEGLEDDDLAKNRRAEFTVSNFSIAKAPSAPPKKLPPSIKVASPKVDLLK